MRLVATPTSLLALAVLIAGTRGIAAPMQLPAGLLLRWEVGLRVWYDDNALLGRRGQFLDSSVAPQGRSPRRIDLGASPLVSLELSRRFAERDLLTITARAEDSVARLSPELRGYDFSATVSYVKNFSDALRLEPSLLISYHADQPDWTYRLLQPRLSATHVFDFGLIAELAYDFTAQQFAHYQNGLPQPKNSYANIDTQAHVAQLDLRMWHGPHLRSNLVATFQAARYAGNLNTNLEDYAGLARGTERNDLGLGLAASLLISPTPSLIVTPGARVEVNRSNSAPYTHNAYHGMLDFLWTPVEGHSVYARIDYAGVDFPQEHFDRRYSNTRRDYRVELDAAYRLRLAAGMLLEVGYHHVGSSSNDCLNFDPQRDEFGLPVSSRSYSCFDQNRAELQLTYQL